MLWWLNHQSRWLYFQGRLHSSSGQTPPGTFPEGSECSGECWYCSSALENTALWGKTQSIIHSVPLKIPWNSVSKVLHIYWNEDMAPTDPNRKKGILCRTRSNYSTIESTYFHLWSHRPGRILHHQAWLWDFPRKESRKCDPLLPGRCLVGRANTAQIHHERNAQEDTALRDKNEVKNEVKNNAMDVHSLSLLRPS